MRLQFNFQQLHGCCKLYNIRFAPPLACTFRSDSSTPGNRSDGLLHDAGNQCSTYTRISCCSNNKSGLHLTGSSLANVKDSIFDRNMRNGIRVEDESTVMADTCRWRVFQNRRVRISSFVSSMACNMEDGAYACQCSVSMTGCFFENNGRCGTGDGFSSVRDSKLILERCIFSHQLATKDSVGLRVEVGGCGVADEGGGSGDAHVSSSGGSSIISRCQFMFNNVGCHVTLSPDIEPPPITKCSFLGNAKIGCVFHSCDIETFLIMC